MKRVLYILLAIVGILVLMEACQQSSPDPIVGTWTLTAVDGGASSGITTTINSGGTWTAVISLPQTGVSPQSGTWSNNGGGQYTIVDTTTGATGTYTATVSGNTLTVSVPPSHTQTFTRQ